MDITAYFVQQRQRINLALKKILPPEDGFPQKIHAAVHYSIFSGGKRLRPILAIAAFESCGGKGDAILPIACSIELIHTYSLIHDDLPAMDNDDFRRGKPTNHKIFGEAIAILAGDALLTYAFELAAKSAEMYPNHAMMTSQLVARIGRAAGIVGMIGGQTLDLEAENRQIDLERIRTIHEMKTSKMMALPLTLGAMLAHADPDVVERMDSIGMKLGLAFQIADDILDICGDEKKLGKPVGSDVAKNKSTYPAAIGVEKSRQAAKRLIEEAIESLRETVYDATAWIEIGKFIIERTY
ncbi:MAG: hypothetical protein B6244_03415 [Candidatus Cloacimonetes bacterium 4572_55]|nr:MAG: hypothetical protein B6244_03415 [Candidatus Cloacimonetes bacterium 4572_55]